MLEVKRKRRAIEEWNAPAKAKANALVIEIRTRERQLTEPLERAEVEILKPSIARFNDEQERKRRAEEQRLRDEQKKREEDARLEEAQQLEDSGEKELAAAVLDAPVTVAPVTLPEPERPAGIQYRDAWKCEIINPALIPREYLMPDEKKIGGIARALKGETQIPGVRVYCEKTVAGRI